MKCVFNFFLPFYLTDRIHHHDWCLIGSLESTQKSMKLEILSAWREAGQRERWGSWLVLLWSRSVMSQNAATLNSSLKETFTDPRCPQNKVTGFCCGQVLELGVTWNIQINVLRHRKWYFIYLKNICHLLSSFNVPFDPLRSQPQKLRLDIFANNL